MINVRLADFNISIDNKYSYIENMCSEYLTSGTPDLTVAPTARDIIRESTGTSSNMGYLEALAVYRKIAEALPFRDAFLMHGVVLEVNGTGIAFLAKSGVGKSTHMMNWKMLPDINLTVVNGDKPLVRYKDGGFYAYGTPWAGKERLHTNTKTELKKLCFIERAEENKAVRLEADATGKLLAQIYRPESIDAYFKTIDLASLLLKQAEVYLIGCTKEPDSARVAFDTVMKSL